MKGFGLCFGAVGMLTLTVICASLLSMQTVSAEVASTQASVTVTSSCEMSSDIDTAHSAELAPGIYRDGIGETTITTICNDANGYAIYANGYTNNELGRNDMLGQNSGRTIATGTADSGDTSAWAIRLTAVDNSVAPTITTGWNAYHAVPNEFTKVVSFANSTMTNASGSKFKVTFAAYATSAQAADTYVGKVRYTLIHPANSAETPCVGTYTINYDSNGGTGNMDSQTVCADRAIGLLPNGFTPPAPVAENQFAVWNTEADGSGYTYLAGQSVSNLASVGGSVTLYAQWAPKYIQDMTASMCQIVASENPFTVYDRRDGNDYTIRYIQDACWMTQNLRITGTVNRQYSNFSTYENVNVCEQDFTTGNGNDYEYTKCHDSDNTANGVWYNYVAASAKTIIGTSNNALATEDICPANWHLPSSFSSLSSVSATSIVKFVPVTGGRYYSGNSSPSDIGSGYWWSSTAYNGTYRNHLIYNGSSLEVKYANGFRSVGLYIRCSRTQ
jgi:hypothetical protein